MPYATITIAMLTLVVYLIGNPRAMWLSSDWHYGFEFITYALCHGGKLHLLVNLLALISFGPALERLWGHRVFLFCYLLAAAFGGLLQIKLLPGVPVIGASAALLALFAAYALRKPDAKIVSLFVVPLPAWAVLALYVGVSMAAMYFNWMPEVSHISHLGGITVGVVFRLIDGYTTKPQA
ncbi:MAG TPA: rhomboid family intramembrane serine protease [Allosphingosinicella sp.]|jgi:membrane associated rhomboid family serine protease